jgi:hypothetical protein
MIRVALIVSKHSPCRDLPFSFPSVLLFPDNSCISAAGFSGTLHLASVHHSGLLLFAIAVDFSYLFLQSWCLLDAGNRFYNNNNSIFYARYGSPKGPRRRHWSYGENPVGDPGDPSTPTASPSPVFPQLPGVQLDHCIHFQAMGRVSLLHYLYPYIPRGWSGCHPPRSSSATSFAALN